MVEYKYSVEVYTQNGDDINITFEQGTFIVGVCNEAFMTLSWKILTSYENVCDCIVLKLEGISIP